MPSENKTPNIGLNQWQGNECPKRQDFVDDNIKIDEKIGSINTTMEEFQRAIENIEVPVKSVNGKIGAVTLTASDVGAAPTSHAHAYEDITGKPSTFPPSGHTHTPSQVGLGSVLNYGIATTAEAQAGVVNNKYVTPALVKAAILHLATTGGISMVKSVQRGIFKFASDTNKHSIVISNINPSKSSVSIYGADLPYPSAAELSQPLVESLTNTRINVATINYQSRGSSQLSYEVIEYV